MDYDTHTLRQLNWVSLYQQLIFLSVVMDASGRAIESKYLDERSYSEQWSSLIFPKEMPSRSDFRPRKEALPQIRAMGGRLHIGPHLRHGHKIWPWKYDLESLQMFHLKGGSVNLYEPALGEGARTRANKFVCTEEGTTAAPRCGDD
jgi:hypothetical protein